MRETLQYTEGLRKTRRKERRSRTSSNSFLRVSPPLTSSSLSSRPAARTWASSGLRSAESWRGPVLWIYDIHVEDTHRGRGYGKEAMLLAEAEGRRRGLGRITLNVFGGNERSRAASTGRSPIARTRSSSARTSEAASASPVRRGTLQARAGSPPGRERRARRSRPRGGDPCEGYWEYPSVTSPLCAANAARTSSFSGSGTLKKSSVRPSSAATSSNSAGEIFSRGGLLPGQGWCCRVSWLHIAEAHRRRRRPTGCA